jgi:hypothetical protein
MNIVASIIFVVVTLPLTLLGLIILFAALILLLPGPIQQARENLEAHPWKSLLLGALNGLGLSLILGLLSTFVNILPPEWRPVMMAIMIFVALILAIPTVIGLGAMIIVVGNRMGERPKRFTTCLRGGTLLLLACLVPFIGWFVFSPILLFTSLGSVVGIIKKNVKQPEQAPTEVLDETLMKETISPAP